MQKQTAVTAYLKSKQLLLFVFAYSLEAEVIAAVGLVAVPGTLLDRCGVADDGTPKMSLCIQLQAGHAYVVFGPFRLNYGSCKTQI